MSTISTGTTLTTALVQIGDTSGNLVIKTGSSNTTAMTISGSDQSVTIPGNLIASSVSANVNASSITTGTLAAARLPSSGVNAASITVGTLAVANGGTGASTLTANNVLLGNGTSALQAVAPGTSGNVLTSDGTTWASSAPGGIGVGQSWASQSRAFGTTYTNSTGKPIQLSVNCQTSNIQTFVLYINGAEAGYAFTYAAGGNTSRASMWAIIPNGSTYSANIIGSGSGGSLLSWYELR